MLMCPVRERRSTPSAKDEEVGGDGAGEREALVIGAGDIAENTRRMLLVAACRGAHVATRKSDGGGDAMFAQ